MKKLMCLLFSCGLLAAPTPAKADPCSTILCLGGLIAGGTCVGGGIGSGGPICDTLTADFFAIRIFDGDGSYDPGQTAYWRGVHLSYCPFDQQWIPPIIKAYGTWWDLPTFPPPVPLTAPQIPFTPIPTPHQLIPCGGPPPPPMLMTPL